MSRVRILLRVACGLIVFCLMFYVVFNLLYVQDSMTGAMQRGFYKERENSLDVVCLGPSTIFSAFNTPLAFHEFGFAAYDFCSGAQPMAAVKYMIQEAEKTQKPALYVIDLRQAVFPLSDLVAVRRVTTNMPWSANRLQAAWEMTSLLAGQRPSDLWDAIFTYPYFHNSWSSFFEVTGDGSEAGEADGEGGFVLLKRLHEGENPEVQKGHLNYWYDINGWQSLIANEDELYTREIMPMPEEEEALLCELCDYCLTLDARVLFVSTPSVAWKEYYAQMNDAVRIVESYGFDYFDGLHSTEEIGLVPEDWYDAGHLNTYGADKYTRALSKYLVSHYDLPDHRGDTAYDSWEACYALNRKNRLLRTNLLCHVLETIRDQGLDALLSFSDAPLFSDEEQAVLCSMGVEQLPQAGQWSAEIHSGKVSPDETVYLDAPEANLAAKNDTCAYCLIRDPGTGEAIREITFAFDPERELMDSRELTVKAVDAGTIASALEPVWREKSLLEENARHSDYVLDGFGFYPQEDCIYADCVFALVNTDCEGQAVYLELEDAEGRFRAFEMGTVERKDFARMYNNDRYVNSGAGVRIDYDDLPEGEYTVRLYRYKYDALFVSTDVWTVSVESRPTAET